MTDIERTKSFLDLLGILYSCDGKQIMFGVENHGEKNDGYPECNKIVGYNGFYTTFNFNEDGSFENVEIYE